MRGIWEEGTVWVIIGFDDGDVGLGEKWYEYSGICVHDLRDMLFLAGVFRVWVLGED